MPQKILITISEGLIGKIIAPALIEDGHRLVLLDKKAKNPVNLLTDNLNRYFKNVETVIHLAANSFWINRQEEGENVMMTFNVLRNSAENNVKRIVYASSINVYDYSTLYLEGKKIDESTPIVPHSKSNWKERKESVFHYSMSKIISEELI